MNDETLVLKMARLQAENIKLRRIAKQSGESARLTNIANDAKALLVRRFSGFSISLDNSIDTGMTRRQWEWARGLLIFSGVHDGKDVTADAFGDALAAIERQIKHLQKEGLRPLRDTLPLHIRRDNLRKKLSRNAGRMGSGTKCKTARRTLLNSGTHSTDRGVVGVSHSRGNRDRRAEIEQRLGINT